MDAAARLAINRAESIVDVCGVAGGATVAVLIRLLVRLLNRTKLAADDFCIGVALLPLWALVVTSILMATQGGLGLTKSQLSATEYPVFYKSVWASNILYVASVSSAKAAVLFLYWRIFTVRGFRIAIYLVGALCLLWYTAATFVFLFQCSPVQVGWNPDADGNCLNLRNVYYGITVSNAMVDVVVMLMPVRVIWRLKLPLKQRIVLILIMCLGIISVVASIGRILSVPRLVVTDLPATIRAPFLYAVIEPAFAIIAACLPTYRPIFTWLGTTVRSSIGSSRTGSRAKLLWSRSGSSRSGKGSNSDPANDGSRFKVPTRRTPAILESGGSHWNWDEKSQSMASMTPPPVPPKDLPPIRVRMPPDSPASPVFRSPMTGPRLQIVTTPGWGPPLDFLALDDLRY